jgi:PAS domain S-box-containing protein
VTKPAKQAAHPAETVLDWPKRMVPVALTITLGAALSIAAFLYVLRSERQRVEDEFAWRSRSHAQALRVNIQRLEESLFTVRDVFQSSPHISYAEFTTTTAELRRRHQGIQLIQWLPRVKDEDRTAFEALAKQEISPTYTILEKNEDRSANVRSAPYPEYAPVYYVDPKEGNEVAFGSDWYRGSHVRAVDRARNTGLISATRRVLLREPTNREVGWAFFLPVYDTGTNPQTIEERRTHFRGYIQGTFRLSALIERSIEDAPRGFIEALFLDRSPSSTEPFLIAYRNGSWTTSPPPVEADFQSGLHHHLRLDVGGRDWHIYFRPSPSWLAAQTTRYPWAALAGGLLITGLLGSLVYSTQRRASLVARLVRERTAELRATQQTLREDIRRRETTELALRQSDDRYRAFVAQSTEAIWRFEHTPGIPTHLPADEQIDLMYRHARLAECNDVMARMYGYARSEDLIGAPIEQIAPRSDPQNVAYFRAFIAGGYQIVDWETREIDKHGQVKFFLNNETGIVEGGLLTRTWGTQRDISERKRQAELQIEQDTRLRLAVSAANLGTWDWDLRTEHLVWSPEAERMYGLEPGSFDGRAETFFALIHPDDREKVRGIIRRALENREESMGSYELRVLRPDGSMRWMVSRGAVLRDADGSPIRRLGTVMDVTAQHLAAEEKAGIERKLQETQKLESLGVLAGGIAHDFNNLLTGILGNASLARMDLPANSPAQPSLEQIELVAQRAADLCRQMLAYSGKGRFIVQHLDLSVLVRDTADLLRLSISKSAVLKFSLEPDLPAISADATQMRQILMNLIINASEAIGEKSGVISITTGVLLADRAYLTEAYLSPAIPEGDYVFLEVSDDGAGMDAETRERIFDPFFTTKFTGRGLGLAAVLGIVRGHQGALKVYSEPGRGTTFKLLLPCADGPAEELVANPAVSVTWRGAGTILVVDDEETVRTVSARMLAAMGFHVLLASNGNEALEIFRPHRDEIVGVLLDLTMPQLDGAATFTQLRRIKPGIRVLLMSGFNEQDAINRFAGKGLAGFIQKPFKPETLRTRLRAIFEPAPEGALNVSLDPSVARF